MKCICCDVEMEFSKKVTLRNFPDHMALIDAIGANAYGEPILLNMYCCPQCKKVEFFHRGEEIKDRSVICPHCSEEILIRVGSDTVCPSCGKDIYEKVAGRKYFRPDNF